MRIRTLANITLSALIVMMGFSCAPRSATQPKTSSRPGFFGKKATDQEAIVQHQLAASGWLDKKSRQRATSNVEPPEIKVLDTPKLVRSKETARWKREYPPSPANTRSVKLSHTIRYGLHSELKLNVFREQDQRVVATIDRTPVVADRRTKLFIDQEDFQLQGAVLDRLRATEMSYWLTAVSYEAMKTTRKTFTRSQTLMTEAESRQRADKISTSDMLKARSFLAAQRTANSRAERRFQKAKRNLESVAGMDSLGKDHSYQSLVSFNHVTPNARACFQNAKNYHPELAMITNEMRRRHHPIGLYPTSNGKRSLDHVLSSENPLFWDDLFAISHPLNHHREGFEEITTGIKSGAVDPIILKTKLKNDITRLCKIIESSKASLKTTAAKLVAQRTRWTAKEAEFRAGKLSISDLIDEEQALENARLAVLDKLAHVIMPQVMLAYVDGSLPNRHGIRW